MSGVCNGALHNGILPFIIYFEPLPIFHVNYIILYNNICKHVQLIKQYVTYKIMSKVSFINTCTYPSSLRFANCKQE